MSCKVRNFSSAGWSQVAKVEQSDKQILYIPRVLTHTFDRGRKERDALSEGVCT